MVEAEYTSAAVLGILAGTDLLAAVPVSVLQEWTGKVRALPMPMLEFPRTLVMLTRPEARWSPLMEAFRDALLAARQPRRSTRR